MGSTWGGSSSASSTAHMRIQIPHRLFITFQYVWEARLALITHQLKATLCQPLPPSLTLSYAQAQNWFDNQDLYICVIFQSLFRLERAKSGAGRRILRELYATWRGVIRRAKNVAYLQGRHLHSSLEARTHTHREREREREAGTQTHRHARKVKLAHLSYFTFLTHFKRGEPKRHKVTAGAGQESGGRGGQHQQHQQWTIVFYFHALYSAYYIYIYILKCMYILYRVYYLFLCFLSSLFSLLCFRVCFLFIFIFIFIFLLGPCRALKQIHAQSPS